MTGLLITFCMSGILLALVLPLSLILYIFMIKKLMAVLAFRCCFEGFLKYLTHKLFYYYFRKVFKYTDHNQLPVSWNPGNKLCSGSEDFLCFSSFLSVNAVIELWNGLLLFSSSSYPEQHTELTPPAHSTLSTLNILCVFSWSVNCPPMKSQP